MLYKGFISYSHAADAQLAPALHSALERFAKPWYRLRAIRLFRDTATLSATPALWLSIERALKESEYFLLLASPEAAASEWVKRELELWVKLRADNCNRLLIVLTDGELVWDQSSGCFDPDKTNSIPRFLFDVLLTEPLFVDLRPIRTPGNVSLREPSFLNAIATIAATLHDRPKDDLSGEDIREHRRTIRLAKLASATLVFLVLTCGVLACIANERRKDAQKKSQLALGRQLAAQAGALLEQPGEAPILGALLAAESLRRVRSTETDGLSSSPTDRVSRHLVPDRTSPLSNFALQ